MTSRGARQLLAQRGAGAALLFVAAVYLTSHAFVEHRAFWITDDANKFLQVLAILDGRYEDFSLRWPGRTLDPSFEFNPLPPPFSRVEGDRLYSQYPPAFALTSAPLFARFGFAGLYVLPLVFSVLLLAGVIAVARQVGLGDAGASASVLLAGLCTPLWFYALVFWEHSIATCLCVWAVHFFLGALRRLSAGSAAACGVSLAVAVWFREELILLAGLLACLVALFAPARRWRLAGVLCGSLAAGLVPLLGFQWAVLDAPLGHHVFGNLASLEGHLGSRPQVFYRLLCAGGERVWSSLALSAPFLVALLFNPSLSLRAFRIVFPLSALYAAAAALFALSGFLTANSPIAHLLASNSLLFAAPVGLLAFVRPRKSADDPGELAARRVWSVVLGYTVLYGLAAPPISAQGIHWGNRFLLVLYPLLCLLAARNLLAWKREARSGTVPLVALVIAVSLAAQLYSLKLLQTKRDFSFRLNEAVARHSEPIVVSDLWWAPQEMFSVFEHKPMFYVRDESQMTRLRERLRAAGYDRFLFVTRPGAADPRSSQRIDDGGLKFFSLDLVPTAVGISPIGARPATGP